MVVEGHCQVENVQNVYFLRNGGLKGHGREIELFREREMRVEGIRKGCEGAESKR